MGRAGILIATAAAALTLAACGGKTINSGRAEETVTNVIAEKTGFRPTDMKCPSGVDAKTGGTFDCTFTGPEGPYTASVKITSVDGNDATFQVDSRRAP